MVGHTITKSLDDTDKIIVDTIAPSLSIQPESDYLAAGDFLVNLHVSEAISKQAGAKKIEAWFNKNRMHIVDTVAAKNGEITTLKVKIDPSESQGPGTLVINVTDQSGNRTTSTYNNFIVDTIPPVIYGTPTDKRRVSSGLLEIGFGINEKLILGVGRTSIRAELNGNEMTPSATKSDEFGNWHTFTLPITKETPQGDADIQIYVSDASGNKVSSLYPGIIVDSQPAILEALEIVPEVAPATPKAPVKKTSSKRKRR